MATNEKLKAIAEAQLLYHPKSVLNPNPSRIMWYTIDRKKYNESAVNTTENIVECDFSFLRGADMW